MKIFSLFLMTGCGSFAGEAKSRGLFVVVIRDQKKIPKSAEIWCFADDAAKVNPGAG